MSATFLSFSDWREALHADQLARIDRIGMELLGIDPKGIIREYLDAVRKDSYNNPSEAE